VKRRSIPEPSIDLNVVPFIDVFSLLCTFLLFSASFLALGVQEVQVPFLTSAPSTKQPQEEDWTLELKAQKMIFWGPKTLSFDWTDQSAFHRELEALRRKHPKHDQMNLVVDDDVSYEQFTHILGLLRLNPGTGPLFPKIVMTHLIPGV
jgi:biopolymer transport protein ExbD